MRCDQCHPYTESRRPTKQEQTDGTFARAMIDARRDDADPAIPGFVAAI